MDNRLLTNANDAFHRGDYHTARNAYRAAAKRYGAKLFRANFELCAKRERARFVKGAVQRVGVPTDDKQPLITYCAPAYNRLGDIERNLLANLEVLSQSSLRRLAWSRSVAGCFIRNIFPKNRGDYLSGLIFQ